jgi:hypothetical protein
MRYATTIDTGEKKRADDGINEDSIAVTVLEDGHREGHSPPEVDLPPTEGDHHQEPTVRGPGNMGEADSEQETGAVSGPAANQETQVFAAREKRQAKPRTRNAGIFVLADGAGGEQAGDIASYIATTVVTEELSGVVHRARRVQTDGFGLELDVGALGETLADEELEEAVTDAVAAANEAIIGYAQEAGLGGIYTTIVVGVYLKDRLYYGWIGDSRKTKDVSTRSRHTSTRKGTKSRVPSAVGTTRRPMKQRSEPGSTSKRGVSSCSVTTLSC